MQIFSSIFRILLSMISGNYFRETTHQLTENPVIGNLGLISINTAMSKLLAYLLIKILKFKTLTKYRFLNLTG